MWNDDADADEDHEYDEELFDTTQLPGHSGPGRWVALIALIVVLVGSRVLPLP